MNRTVYGEGVKTVCAAMMWYSAIEQEVGRPEKPLTRGSCEGALGLCSENWRTEILSGHQRRGHVWMGAKRHLRTKLVGRLRRCHRDLLSREVDGVANEVAC